mmetsp:Transcript_18228/g.48122  ORF Transcript_18228/g.48122 Transcript_18228/m.48122 type:complete len:157 (+) Transcript_18228:216-686(+)
MVVHDANLRFAFKRAHPHDHTTKRPCYATSQLRSFIEDNRELWQEAVDGQVTGEGSSHESLQRWRELHRDYLDIVERVLTGIIAEQGASFDDFMKDCKAALAGGSGFLFEDENYAYFVEAVMAMNDYEVFHELMMSAQRKAGGGATWGASHSGVRK